MNAFGKAVGKKGAAFKTSWTVSTPQVCCSIKANATYRVVCLQNPNFPSSHVHNEGFHLRPSLELYGCRHVGDILRQGCAHPLLF
jgi:hypothetical protein